MMARNLLSLRCFTRFVSLQDDALLARKIAFLNMISAVRQRNTKVTFINMDQTAVQFEMVPHTIVHFVGARSVPVRLMGSEALRVTVTLTVTSRGEKLSPYVIFKGSPNGKIQREFTTDQTVYPQSLAYNVQPKAWMDSSLVLDWIAR
jgi:hypothetical protein